MNNNIYFISHFRCGACASSDREEDITNQGMGGKREIKSREQVIKSFCIFLLFLQNNTYSFCPFIYVHKSFEYIYIYTFELD